MNSKTLSLYTTIFYISYGTICVEYLSKFTSVLIKTAPDNIKKGCHLQTAFLLLFCAITINYFATVNFVLAIIAPVSVTTCIL